MLNRRIVVVALLASLPAAAAGITGTWKGDIHTPRGQTRSVGFAFIQNGNAFTGSMEWRQGDLPVSDGKINGNTISFVVKRDVGIQEQVLHYSGRITSEGIELTMPGFAGSTRRTVTMHRISSERPKPLQPPAPKIDLGPLTRTVPYNGLAKTPPMGWNSWNKFHGDVSDKIVRAVADAMVTSGMRDAGYIYVNIDDTWQGQRDAQGNITPNEKFPDMKALAKYVHSKRLKLGIYSSPGPKTCAGYEGSFRHEAQDARTYASWDIDYIKYDWCSAARVYLPKSMPEAYAIMGRALQATGRPIVYSLCQYGLLDVGEWGGKVSGNLWRTTGDIGDNWASMSHIGFDEQMGRAKYAGPGHWNDPDMLEIGNGGMTDTEYRTHMSLWSLLAAPLLAGNDIANMSAATKAILLNKEVIAVDQDALGKEAVRVSKNGDLEVWARPLAGSAWAAGLFNRGPAAARVTAKWSDMGISGRHHIRDLWQHGDMGAAADAYTAEVPSHGVALIRIQ